MAAQETSKIQHRKLKDKHTTESLRVLSNLVATAMGPHGMIKILGNACGGHLSLTTLSTRLLKTLTPNCPLGQLILTAANQQVQHYGDAGLFTARLTLNLVINGLRSQIDPKLLIKSNLVLLRLLSHHLQFDNFACKMLLEISDVKSWTCVARTMLLSKSLCELDRDEADLIAQLLLESFVIGLPSSDPGATDTLGNVHIVGVPGQSSDQSFCRQGLLLEPNNMSEVKDWIDKLHSSFNSASAIKTVVVDISMAGDSEELLGVTYEGTSLENLEENFLEYIEEFCHQLTVLNVQIVFCQKVIHPRIKEQLRDKSILAIDRLGSDLCPKVLNVTGANPISSFSAAITSDQLGSVDHLSIMEISRKSFLHIKQTSTILATLLLSTYMEEQLEELKAISKNILVVFEHLLRNPSVLFGGGCWQFCLTQFLRTKVNLDKEHLSKELQCSPYHLIESCEYFCRCLEQSSLPDASSGLKCYTHTSLGHLWAVDQQLADDTQSYSTCCICGTTKCQLSELNPLPEEYFTFGNRMQNLSKDGGANLVPPENSVLTSDSFEKPLLMDCFVSWRNSLETSIRMADMALGTNQFIFESAHLL